MAAFGGFGLDKAPLTDISRCPSDRRPAAGLEPVATLPAARREKNRRALLTNKPPYEPGDEGATALTLYPSVRNPHQVLAAEIADAGGAHQSHDAIDLATQAFEHMR